MHSSRPGLACAGPAARGAISEIRISERADVVCGMLPLQGHNMGVFSSEGCFGESRSGKQLKTTVSENNKGCRVQKIKQNM